MPTLDPQPLHRSPRGHSVLPIVCVRNVPAHCIHGVSPQNTRVHLSAHLAFLTQQRTLQPVPRQHVRNTLVLRSGRIVVPSPGRTGSGKPFLRVHSSSLSTRLAGRSRRCAGLAWTDASDKLQSWRATSQGAVTGERPFVTYLQFSRWTTFKTEALTFTCTWLFQRPRERTGCFLHFLARGRGVSEAK